MFTQTFESVTVPILEDFTIESDETFSAQLTTTHPNVVLGDNLASVMIVDNDGEALC